MAWTQLLLEVRRHDSEVCQAWLDEAGAKGVEVRDGVQPMPGVRQPKQGHELLIAYFPRRPLALAALERTRGLCVGRPGLSGVPERDWSTAWRKRVRAVSAGRLWVGPPWKKPRPKSVSLFIEPRMAFGTGDHPTTWLCLKAVDHYVLAHEGCSVLDVGCGTGVLALAAKKLGAARVVGTDNDPIAVEQAKQNARANRVKGVRFSLASLSGVKGRFDLVVANILAGTLVELARPLTQKVGRRLVLSGVLGAQRDVVTRAYERQGLVSRGFEAKAEWVRLDFERKAK